jgi:hypothetical protein
VHWKPSDLLTFQLPQHHRCLQTSEKPILQPLNESSWYVTQFKITLKIQYFVYVEHEHAFTCWLYVEKLNTTGPSLMEWKTTTQIIKLTHTVDIFHRLVLVKVSESNWFRFRLLKMYETQCRFFQLMCPWKAEVLNKIRISTVNLGDQQQSDQKGNQFTETVKLIWPHYNEST